MKKFLQSLAEEKAPGPYPSFSLFHVIKSLELIAKEGPIGRNTLSLRLETGEGATRTLINRLKSHALILVSKKGCLLTEKGEKIWSELQSFFPQRINLERNELSLAACNVAIQIRGEADKVRAGIEQRDAAVIAGAIGAITFVFRGEKLSLPSLSENIAQTHPIAFRQINEHFYLKENDVVVVGSADILIKAEESAFAAAWTLIENNGFKE
jgi:predicted transcriptional regulator